MEKPSTSALLFKDDLYVSKTISGAHGDKYQKDLALLIFERATRKGYDFKLGYEMEIAGKFDDVALFDKVKHEWTLFQTKHIDTSKRKSSQVRFDMLFPSDEATRDKGDFSIFKYLKSYITVQNKIKERKNVIIFTNRALAEFHEHSVEVEHRLVDAILIFEHASYIGLSLKESLINKMIDYVNRDFNSLSKSIIKLFKEGVMDDVIKNFKTPVASILTKINSNVKFLENAPEEAFQMIESLHGEIDVQTAQLSLDKCKELFTGNSRNKTWPLCANETIVNNFLRDLTLCMAQPDDLRGIIDQDFCLWMRTWIRPNYFARLENSQLKMSTGNLEKFVDEKQLHEKHNCDKSIYKKFLQIADGQDFIESVRNDLETQLQNMSNYNADDAKEYYINRKIQFVRLSNITLRDEILVTELSGLFKSQQVLLLMAEPGMGKSTILEYIALTAQQKTNDCVYIFNLNSFNRKFEQINDDDTLNKHLSIFQKVLSKANFKTFLETMSCNGNKRNHFIIFDALDEVLPKHREKVLKMINQIVQVPNVKVLVSARKTIKMLVENSLNVEAMSLVPFDEQDKTNFLRKFWKVSTEKESKFCDYVARLFKVFHSDINHAIRKFAGSPLMLKMLAEVYADNFKKYLNSTQINLEKLMPTQYSTVEFYEKFVKKCFKNKRMKKIGNSYQDFEEDYEFLLRKFVLEHQLLAIKILEINFLQNVLKVEKNAEILKIFEERIRNGTEKSSLVEAIDKDIKFIHLSYAEFLVASFLFNSIENYENEIFGMCSEANFVSEYPLVGIFLFAFIEEQHTTKHIEILERHYKKNSGIVLLACKMKNLKIVKFLLRTKCDSRIINQLLCVGSENNCYDICEYLLENHQTEVDFKVAGWVSLQKADKKEHMDIIHLLIDHTVNLNKNDGWMPLHRAAQNGHWEEIKLLIEYSRHVNEIGNNSWTALHLAALNNNSKMVETLISYSANIEATTSFDETPLHVAAVNGNSEIVEILIKHAAKIEAKSKFDKTPLHGATEKGHLRVVEILIRNSSSIEAKTTYGDTPLHIAAREGYSKVLKTLIQNAANIEAKNSWYKTPLHAAADFGRCEIVKLLIKNSATIEAEANCYGTPLHSAARYGHSKVVNILIENSANIEAKKIWDETPLHVAAENGNSEVAEILIKNSANIEAKTYEKKTPLHVAAENGSLEVVKILIKNSANIEAKKTLAETPLHVAAEKGHSDIVDVLIKNSANIEAKKTLDETPLHVAAEKGSLKVVQILIENSANIEAKKTLDETPLHVAAKNGNLEVTEFLIKSFANIEAKTLDKTPLHVAVEKGHSDVVEIFTKNSANIEAKNTLNQTPLHVAAERGHLEVAKKLIDKLADINAKDYKNRTPLHVASQMGHTEVASLLIASLADIWVLDRDGLSPLSHAVENGHTDIVKILTEHGEKQTKTKNRP